MRVQPSAAIGRGELRRVKRAAADLKFLFRLVDLGKLLEPRNDLGNRLADLRGRTHLRPVDCGFRIADCGLNPWSVRFPIPHSTLPTASHYSGRNARDHVDLRPRSGVALRAAVAQADVVEHRFLRRRLRLFVAGRDRQDDRLARQAVRVAGVQRRVEIHELIEVRRATSAGERGVGIRAVQVAAEAEADLQLAGVGAFDAGHRVEAGRRRQLDAEVVLQPVEDRVLELRRHAHGADALHVRVAADRHQARAAAGRPCRAAARGWRSPARFARRGRGA